MRHHRRSGRAHRATADSSFDLFEAALTGEQAGRSDQNGRQHQKAMQLCRQVERAIGMALAGECHDDLLRELVVGAVEPTGSTAQLIVRLRVPAALSLPEVLERLDRHGTTLRYIVAAAICRKRVPNLMFICLPCAGEGGANA